MSYFYVFATILLTVYGQLIIKWQVVSAGQYPSSGPERLYFLGRLLINPWVISAFAAAALAAVSWMVAMTKLDLSHAYPFVSLSFVLVLLLSWGFFHEPLTWQKLVGVALIICGVTISSHG
jgi:multidrug transporter EmrE-like cation transporter